MIKKAFKQSTGKLVKKFAKKAKPLQALPPSWKTRKKLRKQRRREQAERVGPIGEKQRAFGKIWDEDVKAINLPKEF